MISYTKEENFRSKSMVALLKNKIQSIDGYNQKMAASMVEKTFFFAYLDDSDEVIVDFGCADAIMLNKLRAANQEIEYIGYDMNPEMVQEAVQNAKTNGFENFTITSDWRVVEEKMRGKRSSLLLSSVIHEVYSYGSGEDVDVFWNKVFGGEFYKIFVRDMMCSENIPQFTTIAEVQKIKNNFSPFLIKQWELRWGPLLEFKSMLHFLLTYHYLDNWTREYLENYFPISYEEFTGLVTKSQYQVHKMHPHKVPYLVNKIAVDFGIELQENTHIVAVLTKK